MHVPVKTPLKVSGKVRQNPSFLRTLPKPKAKSVGTFITVPVKKNKNEK